MKNISRISCLLLLLLSRVIFGAEESDSDMYSAGNHYQEIDISGESSQVEGMSTVEEILWYGCPHCYAFEPLVAAWKNKQPENIQFSQSHVVWGGISFLHAKMFYAIDSMPEANDLHAAVFSEVHEAGNQLARRTQQIEFITNQGLSEDVYLNSLLSEVTADKVEQAKARTTAYGITQVPSFVVNGMYRVETNEFVTSHEEMLEVVDFLTRRKSK